MKKTVIILLSVILSTNAFAQLDRSSILDKIRTGATQFQNDPAVRNSAPVVVEVVDENGRREQRVTPHVWTDENVDLLETALQDELQRKNVQLRAEKQSNILNHLERYTAHKAALFSTMPPSEELAEVMAAQIVRSIEWANRPDIVYPTEPARMEAKTQINLILDTVQDAIIKQVSDTIDAEQSVLKHIYKIRAQYDWRVDSPFFVHGKKVLKPHEFTGITNQCLRLSAIEFDANKIQSHPSSTVRGASEPASSMDSYLWGYTHTVTRPLIQSYYEGMNRIPTKEETSRDKELLDQLQARIKR